MPWSARGGQRTCRVSAPFLPCGSQEPNSGMGAHTLTHRDTAPVLKGHLCDSKHCMSYVHSQEVSGELF